MAEEKKNNRGGWWGIILIAVGALFLLHNFGFISLSWYALWHAWPVALIVWGIGALDIDERAKRVVITVIVAAALFWVMGGFGMYSRMMPQDRMMMQFPGRQHYWR